MKRIYLCLTLFLMRVNDASALVNGIDPQSDFPSVQLRFKGDSHICSGTFIDPYTILTAAHCIKEPKEKWESFSLVLQSIFDSLGREIEFKQIKYIPHPQFKYGLIKSKSDLGLIKLKKNSHFTTFPNVGKEYKGPAIFYGCGIVDKEAHTLKCLEGKNTIRSFLGFFLSWSLPSDTIGLGEGVTVAKNDSGGALIDEKTREIIGVHWGTLSGWWLLPSLSFDTAFSEGNNLKFIKDNMGELNP